MPHVAHFSDNKAVVRANAVVLGLVWGGLAFCVIAAVAYDVHNWFNAW
jgi:hypothetical protein